MNKKLKLTIAVVSTCAMLVTANIYKSNISQTSEHIAVEETNSSDLSTNNNLTENIEKDNLAQAPEPEPTQPTASENKNQDKPINQNTNIASNSRGVRTNTSVTQRKTSSTTKSTSSKSTSSRTQGTSTITTSTGLRISIEERDLFARLVSAEATGENFEGKLAVATVIMNRVKSTTFANTITGVIYGKEGGFYQFTPVLDGRINEPATVDSFKAVDSIINGYRSFDSKVMWFLNPRKSTSSWITTNKIFYKSIGNHDFYY